MTIKSQKNYDQHAHDQQTQATPWAAQYGGDTSRTERSLRGMVGDAAYDDAMGGGGAGMGVDTRRLMAGAAAGERPWHESYDAGIPRRGPGSDSTVDRRKSGPLTNEDVAGMSPHAGVSAANWPAARPSAVGATSSSAKLREFRNPGGGGIVERTPERDAQLHRDNPGLMDRWLQRGSRSDGGNG